MLTKPIEQSTKLTRKAIGLYYAGNLTWELIKNAGIYIKTGSPHAVAGAIAWSVTAEPGLYALFFSHLNARAAWARRKKMQEFAHLPSVNEMKVITAGHFESESGLVGTLHTNSIVFVKTDRALPEEITNDGKWVLLKKLDSTQVVLSLKVGDTPLAHPVRMSIQELFDDKKMDPALRASWNANIDHWRKQFPLLSQINPYSALNKPLSIDASIVSADHEIDLGHLATGDSVRKILKSTPKDKALEWFHTSVLKEDPLEAHFSPATIEVRKNQRTSCFDMIRKLLGTLYIRESE
jgi:hypothetical protein